MWTCSQPCNSPHTNAQGAFSQKRTWVWCLGRRRRGREDGHLYRNETEESLQEAAEGFWFSRELMWLLNLPQEIQHGGRQEATPAPSPGKMGSLLPQRDGWGKDPLLPASSSPTALPASRDKVSEPRAPPRHQHCHEQAAASTRKGCRVYICKELRTWWMSLWNIFFYLGLEVEGVERGISNIPPCAAFLYMTSKETLAQRSLGLCPFVLSEQHIWSSSSLFWPSDHSSFPKPLPPAPQAPLAARVHPCFTCPVADGRCHAVNCVVAGQMLVSHCSSNSTKNEACYIFLIRWMAQQRQSSLKFHILKYH